MHLRIHEFDLPLRHVFTISRESISVQKTLIVELEEDGRRGYGEATTNQYYGFTFENMAAALESVRDRLAVRCLEDPAALWDELAPWLEPTRSPSVPWIRRPTTVGQAARKASLRIVGPSAERLPVTNYTIGIDRIDIMVAKMQEFPGWPVYKIKLGTPHDLDIVRSLREHTEAVFRVDANCGWSVEEAIRNLRLWRR